MLISLTQAHKKVPALTSVYILCATPPQCLPLAEMSRSPRPVAVVVGLLLLSACLFGDFAFAFVVVSIIPFAFGFWLLISRSLPWFGCCLPWVAAAADTFANIDYATDTPAPPPPTSLFSSSHSLMLAS